MPPDQLRKGASLDEFAPLIVLASIGWAIAGLFRSLFSRRKHFGLLELLVLVTGLAILLGLIGLAVN